MPSFTTQAKMILRISCWDTMSRVLQISLITQPLRTKIEWILSHLDQLLFVAATCGHMGLSLAHPIHLPQASTLVGHLSPQAVLEQSTKGYIKIDFQDDRVRTLVNSPTKTMKITGKTTKTNHFRTLEINQNRRLNCKLPTPEKLMILGKMVGL